MAELLHPVPVDDEFLTEEGHPIGQLVMADNSVAVAVDTSVETADAELIRSKEEELGADLALYPGYEDMDKRQKAKVLFVVDGLKSAQIAQRLSVPERTVVMWIYNERWDSLVRKEIMVKDVQAKLALARMRAEKRNTVADAQLEQAEQIRGEAMKAIRDGHIKGGTDAWAAAAKVEQTILGIKEGGEIASTDGRSEDDEEKGGKASKTPLVAIFTNGLPAATRRPV